MKKYTRIAYLVIIVLILLFGFFVYKVSGKNSTDGDVKEKSLSEIKYLESKFLNLYLKIPHMY